jgi:hypothetical protein
MHTLHISTNTILLKILKIITGKTLMSLFAGEIYLSKNIIFYQIKESKILNMFVY